jgi:hypothetical protein
VGVTLHSECRQYKVSAQLQTIAFSDVFLEFGFIFLAVRFERFDGDLSLPIYNLEQHFSENSMVVATVVVGPILP